MWKHLWENIQRGTKTILLVWSELLGDFFSGSIFVLVSLIDAAPISKWLKETVCIALCSILIWNCWNRSSSGFIPKFYCAQGLKRISGFDTTYHGWWRAKGAPEHLSKKLTNGKWYILKIIVGYEHLDIWPSHISFVSNYTYRTDATFVISYFFWV